MLLQPFPSRAVLATAFLAFSAAAVAGPFAANTNAPLIHGREYMVVANHPNLLHVLDLGDNRVLKTCELSESAIPGAAQVSPDHTRVYVLNDRARQVVGVELDTCKEVFKAEFSTAEDERAIAFMSLALSPDGKELYSVHNPSRLHSDRYEALPPRLAVYETAAGLEAEPVRVFPMPRQIGVMQTGDDGTLYAAGQDLYKIDVQTGKYEVALPLLNWRRPGYGAPDALNAWTTRPYTHEFAFLYTAPRFKPGKEGDLASADFKWGILSIDLATGKTSLRDFADLTEVYFTGVRSPKNPDHLFVVLNVLRKYDIAQQKLLASADVGHAYYQANINKAGNRVYLSGTLHDVAVFNADTLEKITSIELPGGDMSSSSAQIFVR
jgi:quinohemoprotein amine dehydrogenase beta subunit